MLKSRIWAIHRTTSLERIGSPLIEPLVKMLQRGSAPLGRFCGTRGWIRDTGALHNDGRIVLSERGDPVRPAGGSSRFGNLGVRFSCRAGGARRVAIHESAVGQVVRGEGDFDGITY